MKQGSGNMQHRNRNRQWTDKSMRQADRKAVWIILLTVFLIGAVAGFTVLFFNTYRKARAEREFAELAERTQAVTELSDPEGKGPEMADTEETEEAKQDPYARLAELGVPIPEKEIDFGDLLENTNADIYAWIYIPDSLIDYPVLQHPTDNLYYLNHNLDGGSGYPGCIYSENYNELDFTDPNTVLYGHNMKNGSMFAGLHKYEDSEYFEEHPYVYIYTPEKLLVYEIFAAYEYSSEHILYNHDFRDKAAYQTYLEDIFGMRSMNCNLRGDVEVTSDDRILTLSTCIANKPDKRYLVQGVLLNED